MKEVRNLTSSMALRDYQKLHAKVHRRELLSNLVLIGMCAGALHLLSQLIITW